VSKSTQKYLFIHRSEPSTNTDEPSPAQLQASFAKWTAWKAKFEQDIVDWGDRLKPTGRVVSASTVSDGPFVESKEIVGGFMIVAAESYEHAVEIAQGMPTSPGARIEIREMAGAKL